MILTANLRSVCVDLEKHLKVTASCNQPLQIMFEVMKFSEIISLLMKHMEVFKLLFILRLSRF